jgi:hypothetical protein
VQRLEVACGGDLEQLAEQRIDLRQECHNAPAVRGQEIEFLLEKGDTGEAVKALRQFGPRRRLGALEQLQQRVRQPPDLGTYRGLSLHRGRPGEHVPSVEHIEER